MCHNSFETLLCCFHFIVTSFAIATIVTPTVYCLIIVICSSYMYL
jgi:hypothetical protein